MVYRNSWAIQRVHEITETCPHCESEITMTWDVSSRGYHAFCPVCGERLMLCDECLHSGPNGEYTGLCDYDSKTDTCRRQDKSKRQILRAKTPLGTVTAQATLDPEHPGIWLDLCRGEDEIPLALVEFSADDADLLDGSQNVITRVWGDARQEDYTDRVVHQNIEWGFAAREDEQT